MTKIRSICHFCGGTAVWYGDDNVTICDNFFCLDEHIGVIGSYRLGILTSEQIEELQKFGSIKKSP
jgi:hypothetical protein